MEVGRGSTELVDWWWVRAILPTATKGLCVHAWEMAGQRCPMGRAGWASLWGARASGQQFQPAAEGMGLEQYGKLPWFSREESHSALGWRVDSPRELLGETVNSVNGTRRHACCLERWLLGSAVRLSACAKWAYTTGLSRATCLLCPRIPASQ